MADESPRSRGVVHRPTTEQLVAFRDVPAADKLRWLSEMSRLLERSQSEEQRETMQRFRRGDL